MKAAVVHFWRPGVVALSVAALAALAGVLVLRTGHASSAKSLPHGHVVAVSAKLVPQSHLFGEPIRVNIDTIVDRSRVDPSSVRLHTNWTPYAVVGSARPVRQDVGSFARLSWRVQLHCVESRCLPGLGSVRRFRFQSASITSDPRDGASAQFAPFVIKWPEVAVASRLDPIDLKRQAVVSEVGHRVSGPNTPITPPWRADSRTLDAVSYRFRPGLVFWTALALALVLFAAAGILVRPLVPLPAWLLRWRPPAPTPLERALAGYERASASGGAAEQRLALELLAAELGRSGEGGLAWTASELAWSPGPPTGERGGMLALGVRGAIERSGDGTNGRNGTNGR